MIHPRLIFALAVAAFVFSLGFALHEYRRMRETAARMANARDHFTLPPRNRPRAQAPGKQVARIPTPRREMDERLEALFQTAPKGPGGVPLIQPEKLFADYPGLHTKYVAAAAARMTDLFGPYVVAEGLSPAQRQQLSDIFAQREKTWADLQAAASTQGKSGTDADIMAQNAVANQQREQALVSLLGPAAYERLGEYRKSLPARTGLLGLNTLIEASLDTMDPMTPDKMNQLAALVTKNNIYSVSMTVPKPGAAAFSTVRQEAQSILSADQLAIFELLLDHRQVEVLRAGSR